MSYLSIIPNDVRRVIFLKLSSRELDLIYLAEVIRNNDRTVLQTLEEPYFWKIMFEELGVLKIGPFMYTYLLDGNHHDFLAYHTEYVHVKACLFTSNDYVARRKSDTESFISIKGPDITNVEAVTRCLKLFNVDTSTFLNNFIHSASLIFSYEIQRGFYIRYTSTHLLSFVKEELIGALIFNMLYHGIAAYITRVDLKGKTSSKRLHAGFRYDV